MENITFIQKNKMWVSLNWLTRSNSIIKQNLAPGDSSPGEIPNFNEIVYYKSESICNLITYLSTFDAAMGRHPKGCITYFFFKERRLIMNLNNDTNQMFRIYRNVRPVFNFNWYSSYGEKLSASQILDEEGNVISTKVTNSLGEYDFPLYMQNVYVNVNIVSFEKKPAMVFPIGIPIPPIYTQEMNGITTGPYALRAGEPFMLLMDNKKIIAVAPNMEFAKGILSQMAKTFSMECEGRAAIYEWKGGLPVFKEEIPIDID